MVSLSLKYTEYIKTVMVFVVTILLSMPLDDSVTVPDVMSSSLDNLGTIEP